MKNSLSRTTFEAVIEHSTSEAQQQQQHRIHSSSTNSSVNRQRSTTKSPVLQHRTHHVHPARPASSFMTETITVPSADAAKPLETQSSDVTRTDTLTDGEVLDRRNSSDELDGYRSSCEESLRTGREDSSSCSSGRHSEGPATAESPTTGTATATHEAHAYPHRHRAQRYRGRGSPVQSAARDEERQRLVAMSLDAEVAQAAAAAALTESSSATEPQPRPSRPASTTVTTTRTTAASPSPQSSPVAAPGAAREGGLRGVRTPSPTPITASTSTKTSLAMISVALNVESRSAEAVRRASAGNSPRSGPRPSTIEPGSGNTSMAMLLRVPVPVVTAAPDAAAPREDGGADPAAGLRSSTASRMSRSSSNDSGAVEASMESGQCATATPHDRPPSCTSPHSVASGPATAVVSPTRHLSSPESHRHSTPISANVHRPGSPSPRPRTTSAAKPTAPLLLQASVPVKAASIDLSLGRPTAAADAPVEAPKANSAVALLPIAETAAPTSSSTPLQASAGGLVSPPPESTAHELLTSRAAATAGEHVTHVADVTTRTSTNTRVPVHEASHVGSPSSPPLPPPSQQQQQQQRGGLVGSPAAVDISSSSSVGGHHLSVTEGNAFLKQSGSRREEAFYNTIQPYQETLVREAVRQAPHTVEHWLHQHAGTPCAGASEAAAIAAAAAAVATARSPLAPGRSSSPSDVCRRSSGGGSDDVDGVVADPDDVAALCEARWEAYQQYEAEDMSNLNILASAHLAEGAADGNATLLSPRKRNSGAAAADGSPVTSPVSPTSPEHQVDKDLVELAARLWWTVRFRHFYRTSAAAYEVQRQAAEAAGLSPPSPSAWSLATTPAREAGANGGTAGSGSVVTHSRCSTPASQNPAPMPSATPSPPAQQHNHQHQPQQQLQTHVSNDSVVAAPPPLPPSVFHASLDRSTAAGSNANGAATSMVLPPSVSGTATPCMVGSFGAPSLEGIASAASTAERQYAAQKHRALQLLAAFVPRYHGTRRLFVSDVLRCEKLGNAAAAAAAEAAAGAAVVPATASGEGCNPLEPAGGAPIAAVVDEKPVSSTAVAAPQQQRIVRDADNDDEDDDGGAGGDDKICRMIMLEYVCYRFRRPCVMDIKMGSRQYGLHPSAEKKLSKERKAKLSTSARYGIRLAGYRRWNAEERRYNFRSKLQCRALSLNEVKSEISAFLLNSRELERVFRRQLQRLRVAFSQQTVFRFYTSSLLFVYDAEDSLATARVTMVDFAYTYESRELLQGGDPDADFAYDVGYLKAIDTLLSLLA